LLGEKKSDEQMAEELCLAALGRFPGDKERKAAQALLANTSSRREAAQDFLWALLNSREFLFVP
jgi:hypothetical protein